MRSFTSFQNVLVGASALLFAGAQFSPRHDQSGPVLTAAVSFVARPTASTTTSAGPSASSAISDITTAALSAFANAVRPLSRPEALADAFRSYFAYKTTHPDEVRKPYLYFV